MAFHIRGNTVLSSEEVAAEQFLWQVVAGVIVVMIVLGAIGYYVGGQVGGLHSKTNGAVTGALSGFLISLFNRHVRYVLKEFLFRVFIAAGLAAFVYGIYWLITNA